MTRDGRPVLALLAAETLSLTGTRLSMIAIPWLVLSLTGDAMLTGFTAFVEMLPYILAKGLGGPFIDRLGARFVAIAGDLASAIVVAAIPISHGLGVLHVNTLLPIVFAMGLLRGPADAAKQALVPLVSGTAGVPLERVTGLAATADRLATILGAGAAGVLVAQFGAAPALALNASAFGLAALAVSAGIPRGQSAAAGSLKGYLGALREGWDFLAKDPVLVGIVAMIAITNLLDQALIAVMLPVWAMESGGGPGAIGLLVAVQSAFAVIGAAIAARFGERIPRLTVYTIAFLIAGAPRFLILLPGVPVPAILATLAVAGFAIGFINPIISAVCFERIPAALVGRVTSLIAALAWALMPFGGLLGGATIAGLGLPASLMLAAAAYLAATMAPLVLPRFRALAVRAQGA